MHDTPRIAVTVDVVLFANTQPPEVLLIQRGQPPFAGQWALPGGFVETRERVADAAARELVEEAGIDAPALAFFGYFDAINRDPRGRTLSLAFWGTVDKSRITLRADDDAADAKWFALDDLPPLAFDHGRIVAEAIAARRAA